MVWSRQKTETVRLGSGAVLVVCSFSQRDVFHVRAQLNCHPSLGAVNQCAVRASCVPYGAGLVAALEVPSRRVGNATILRMRGPLPDLWMTHVICGGAEALTENNLCGEFIVVNAWRQARTETKMGQKKRNT